MLSGIPGTGKSTFARHLVREHGFAHYDLEHFPHGWPIQELKRSWDANRSAFVAAVRQHHDRIALDWGFPVSCLGWVEELQKCGVKLVWFDGNVARARQAFEQRGRAAEFDVQIAAIQKAGYEITKRYSLAPRAGANRLSHRKQGVEEYFDAVPAKKYWWERTKRLSYASSRIRSCLAR